jgi:ubiquinone/menaquinone biosynthesis C-methylase UbiE
LVRTLVVVVTVQAKRTFKIEKLARIYDDEIAPCWGSRFGKLLLRNLALPERGQVLDVSCGTGAPTIEILRRMSEGSRLIAIDESSAMLDVVRRKVAELGPLGKKGVFFRTESAVPKLSFADDVYDLVVCNLGVGDMPSIEAALRDFARVAKPDGEVRCTLPLAGTFDEFHDLYREVLVKHDKHEALDRLDHYVARYPTFDHVEHCMAAANLTGGLEVEEFSLLFRSSREFFFAPVIEYGPLADWKAIAGGGQDMQDVFWYIKEAIDAYFAGGPFHVTVKAGCVVGKKPDRQTLDRLVAERRAAAAGASAAARSVPATSGFTAAADTQEDSQFDERATDLPWSPRVIAQGSVRAMEPDDAEVPELAAADFSLDEDSLGEPAIDAFIEGKKRPHHLAD